MLVLLDYWERRHFAYYGHELVCRVWKACTLTTCILFNNSSRQQHDNDIIIVGLLMTPSVRRCRRRCRRRRRCSDDDVAEADANADAKSRMMDIIICFAI